MSANSFLIIRSVVSNEKDREAFDHWYSTDHMKKACLSMGTDQAWRFWSRTDPSVHYAVYKSRDIGKLLDRKYQALRAEFDATWPNVQRTRDVIEEVDMFVPPEIGTN